MHLLNKSLFLPRLLSALTVPNMKSPYWNTGASGLQQKKKKSKPLNSESTKTRGGVVEQIDLDGGTIKLMILLS